MIGFGFSVFTQAILGLGGGFRGSALNLDFTSGNRVLDPRVTFSRTTNATLTNSAGLVANAPMNLLTFSEQFDNAAWVKAGAGVLANTTATTDPLGGNTADKLIETSAGGAHIVRQGSLTTVAANYTYSAYLKAAERTWALFNVDTPGGTNGFAEVYVDLTNGEFGTQVAGNGYTIVSKSITSAGNGWWRVSLTYTATARSDAGAQVFLATGNGTKSYTGNGTSGIYLWGAQLELGSTATTYNPTTVKNLLGFTEHFDNAAWTKSNASISATKVDDIYGQPFAQKLVPAAGTNAGNISQAVAVGVAPYTFSFRAKAAEQSVISVVSNLTGIFRANIFNLTTQGVSPGVGWTAAITPDPAGNGWFICSCTATADVAASKSFQISNNSTGWTGDGTSGIYIFGAQLSDSASVDPYVYNPVAAPSSVAYYGPRFDYDPVTLAPKGLLIEEQRSNLLLNSAALSTQVVTVAATAHTLSFYGTGTIVLSGASTGTVVGTGAYPARTTLTFTPTVGVLTLTVTGSVTMAQLEAGAFATSYIPTVASQVTRAADSASMIGNNFARWYNANEGTVFSDADTARVAGDSSNIYTISDGTMDNRITAAASTLYHFYVSVAGVPQANIDVGTYVDNVFSKNAGAYKVNDFAASLNGSVAGTDASGTLPVVNRLALGANAIAGGQLNGHIKRFSYYNRRLANTELQAITS